MSVASGCGLAGTRSCCIHLLDRTACRTIRNIHAGKLERLPTVIAAAGVELRGMVREGRKCLPRRSNRAASSRCLGFFEPLLRNQHVGKTPPDLRIVARKRR
jgi:hypothetical protein